MADTQQPAQSKSLLIEWANGEAAFVRQIVADVLASKSRPSEGDVDAYFELLKKEKGLHADPAPKVPPIPQSGVTTTAAEVLRLRSVKITGGVNALKDGEAIPFGKNLTVIYGENGSGKSGYVRVLKRAAGVIRAAEPILGNVHKSVSSSPTATFEVSLGDEDQSPINWKNEEGLAPFTQIAVFDSKSVGAHVDDDLTYVYTPGELGLFPIVQETVERVRDRLTQAIGNATDARNPFIVQFKRDTVVYPLIEKMGASTDLVRLKALATLTDVERAHKTQLEVEIDALKSADVKAQLKVAEDQLNLVQQGLRIISAIKAFDAAEYQKLRAIERQASTKVNSVTSEAFANSGIPGVLTDSWKTFIDAGEAYLVQHSVDGFPHESDGCIYCQQPLGTAAVALVTKYREFSRGEARRKLSDAQERVQQYRKSLVALTIGAAHDGLQAEVIAGRGESLPTIVAALQEARLFQAAVDRGDSDLPAVGDVSSAEEVAKQIDAKLSETVSGLKAKSTEREQLLASRQKEFAELEARALLATLWPGIERRVVDAKWADEATSVSRGFMAILRSLTDRAKDATKALLNTNFETRFAEEAKALRAPTVILEFPGSKGQTLRRKIVGQHKPGEVLSEGEQKVIAIADFLAETQVREPSGPVIFDDPVNSLDYRRAEEVAARIKLLSKTNQVVVFTHSIMFASMLLEKADKKTVSYVDIKNDGGPGVVAVGTHPRTDSPSNLLGRLEVTIVAAKKATGDVQEALIYKGFDLLRALTEVITEQNLFKAVAERYRPNVRVDSLENINVAALDDCIKRVVACYRRACRVTEAHSQPMDHLGSKPGLSDLETDLEDMRSVIKQHG